MKPTILIIARGTMFATLLALVVPATLTAQSSSLLDRFKRIDRNGDGEVTKEELPQPAFFDRLDRNGDGVIRVEELPGRAAPNSEVEKSDVTSHLDLAYGDHERQVLDLYEPVSVEAAPIMVHVHGGGWRRGDKGNVTEKVKFFSEKGWVFVSVNYRLLPDGGHPVNVEDVAKALAWVHDEAAQYGGDPNKLFLMGHSAGAHLAALVATSEEPLKKWGKERSILKGVIPLDTNAYDLPRLMESASQFYGYVFGEDPSLWKEASPITHVEADAGIAPFLVCYSRGMRAEFNPERPAQAIGFAEALREAGISAEVVDASDRNHGEINQWFGRDDDTVVTAAAYRFLEAIVGSASSGSSAQSRSAASPSRSPRPRRSAGTGDLVRPPVPEHRAHLDLVYDKIENVDPNLLSLDLYVPEGDGKDRPVMIMIHGGGWRGGDKASPVIVGAKMAHFVGEGYVYASVNYRLSPQDPQEEGVKHPTHAEDCAKAIAWIHDHAAEYGGDPDQMHLMGHSAGGHLAGLVATNERFLEAEGKDLSIIKTNVLLDPAAIDIPGYLTTVDGGGMTALYHLAFGQDKENHIDASPQDHVSPGKGIPPTLLFYGGERMLLDQYGPAFAKALTEAGSPSRAVDTIDLDHGQINSFVGMVDEGMTKLIMRLHAGESASQFPAVLEGGESAVSTEGGEPIDPTASIGNSPIVRFEQDYVAGSLDGNGEFMGGTETMRIVAHGENLYAGNGYWTDQPGDDPRPGAQILVKRGVEASWELLQNFPAAVRISAMESVNFTRDGEGNELDVPVSLLLADAGLIRARDEGPLSCYVLNEETNRMEESPISASAPRAFIRAFGFHRDEETGREMVFAGTGGGEVYRGVYDEEAPGRIRWQSKPEYQNPDFDGGAYRRCQGFTVANGKLYASIAPRLLERVDGASPGWKEVFCWEPEDRAGAGLRGITAVPSFDGSHEVIIGSREQEGRILRIDPLDGYSVTDELNSQDFLKNQLGQFRGGKLVAYNRLVPGKHPETGAPIHWLTVAGVHPGKLEAAWLLIRHADATYEPVCVFDDSLENPPLLVSTRTLEFAPWSDREFYTGGFDGAANDRKNHNSAWIFRGRIGGGEGG